MAISTFAQKTLEKQWDASSFKTLQIFADEAFKIEIITVETDEIKLTTKVEGETYESVMVNTSEDNKTLTLSTGKSPFFEAENDKLAAHKVISIEMKLHIPKGKNVVVSSKLASFKGSGIFENLTVNLERGSIELLQFSGNAKLYTKASNIAVAALKNVSAEAISKHGVVVNELAKKQKFLIDAETISGNIIIKQTE